MRVLYTKEDKKIPKGTQSDIKIKKNIINKNESVFMKTKY